MRTASDIRRLTNGSPVCGVAISFAAGTLLSLSVSAASAAGVSAVSVGSPAESFVSIDAPRALMTRGYSRNANGQIRVHQLLAAVVVRRASGWESLPEDTAQFVEELGLEGVRFEATQGDARVAMIRVSDVAMADRVARAARQSGIFESAYVAQTDLSGRIGRDERGRVLLPSTGGTARGSLFNDPQFPDQWYLTNPGDPGKTNDILPILDQGFTGDGVKVGLVSRGRQQFESGFYAEVQGQDFNVDPTGHPDLAANINLGLSQEPNTQLPPSSILTGMAGLIAAEADNANDIVGIAPNAELVGLVSGTPVRQQKAIDDSNGVVDVMVFQMGRSNPEMDYFDKTDIDYSSSFADFVITAQQNALLNGRGRKGIVQAFGTGEGVDTFPNWERYLFGNAVSLPALGLLDLDAMGAFVPPGPGTSGFPLVSPGPRINYQQLVADPRALVVAPISQNENFIYETVMGTEVLTSVYAEVDTDEPDGMITLRYSSAGSDTADLIDSNTAQAVLGGIISLMLEANPSLSIRDIQHIIVNNSFPIDGMGYDPSLPYSILTDWQVNGATPAKPHSDRFGFGKLDVQGAFEDALTWTPPGQLFLLDTGVIAVEEGTIETAEFLEINEVTQVVEPGDLLQINGICVRQNFTVEQIVVTLNIEGADSSDLFIELVSPQGTASTLHFPNQLYPTLDFGFVYLNQRFVTFKHWGEPAGGNWRLNVIDYGPDEATPEGDDENDIVTFTGQYGLLGQAEDRSEKTLIDYRVEIFSRNTGLDPFTGCPTGTGTCPGDINADGIVNVTDLALFLQLYNLGDFQADLDRNGVVNFTDLRIYIGIWRPGFCNGSGLPYNRPSTPTPGNSSPNLPVVRPI